MSGNVKIIDIRPGWIWTNVVVEAIEDCWRSWYNVSRDGPYHTSLDKGKRKVVRVSNSSCIWAVGETVPADKIL